MHASLFIYRYIEGKTLKQFLRTNSSIPLESRYSMAQQILHLLQYLHTFSEPIVHSDISPQNFIIDNDFNVHLIDFGCAQAISRLYPASRWIGKYHYLSPEQATGKSWDQRSDLYQAGLILYELFTGQVYLGQDTNENLVALASNPPMQNLDNIPAKLRHILANMLNPETNLRYQSADECIIELSRISQVLLHLS